MFVCSICGKQIKDYNTLHINFAPTFYRREVCKECEPRIRKKVQDFVNNITKSLTEELND